MTPDSDRAIPTLPSRSIPDTVAFYRRLGFEGGPHAFNPRYAILVRGAPEIHFFAHEALVPETSSAGCYLRVADAEAIHRAWVTSELPRSGVPRMDALEDKPWGLREFAVRRPRPPGRVRRRPGRLGARIAGDGPRAAGRAAHRPRASAGVAGRRAGDATGLRGRAVGARAHEGVDDLAGRRDER